MKASENICERCGHQLKLDWIYCTKCGKSVNKVIRIQCRRCYNIIEDQNPVYCPFCKENILDVTLKDLKGPSFTLMQYLGHLKFNFKDSEDIINNKYTLILGIIAILVSGFSYAISIQLVSVLTVGPEIQFSRFIGRFISQTVILLLIGLSTNFSTSLLKIKTKNLFFIRLMGSYALLFILKDLVYLILSAYMRFFNESYYITEFNQSNLTLMVHIFVYIHIIFFIHKISPLGIFTSLILVSYAYLMVILFLSFYISPFVNLLSERLYQWRLIIAIIRIL